MQRLARVLMAWLVATVITLGVVDATVAGPSDRGGPEATQPVSGDVEIGLMVVHATNDHNRTDARLKPVMQHLRFLNFSGYSLLDQQDARLRVGQDHEFRIAGDRRVRVKLLSRDARQAKLRVEMFDAKGSKKLDTTVSIHRNKSFMVAGPKHDGGVLVLPLTARY